MTYTFKQVLDKIQDFLSGHNEQDYSENDSLISTIEQAIQKKTAVHVILVLQVILSNMIPVVNRLLSKILQKM